MSQYKELQYDFLGGSVMAYTLPVMIVKSRLKPVTEEEAKSYEEKTKNKFNYYVECVVPNTPENQNIIKSIQNSITALNIFGKDKLKKKFKIFDSFALMPDDWTERTKGRQHEVYDNAYVLNMNQIGWKFPPLIREYKTDRVLQPSDIVPGTIAQLKFNAYTIDNSAVTRATFSLRAVIVHKIGEGIPGLIREDDTPNPLDDETEDNPMNVG